VHAFQTAQAENSTYLNNNKNNTLFKLYLMLVLTGEQ
jgi:hypothetical protein